MLINDVLPQNSVHIVYDVTDEFAKDVPRHRTTFIDNEAPIVENVCIQENDQEEKFKPHCSYMCHKECKSCSSIFSGLKNLESDLNFDNVLSEHMVKNKSRQVIKGDYFINSKRNKNIKNKTINLHCSHCDFFSENEFNLITHSRVDHDDVTPFKCIACDNEYPTHTELLDHLEDHLESDNKISCQRCSNSFNITEVTSHILSCKTKRPYECQQCSKCFEINEFLLNHEKGHNKRCPYCNECFLLLDDYQRHLKDVHISNGDLNKEYSNVSKDAFLSNTNEQCMDSDEQYCKEELYDEINSESLLHVRSTNKKVFKIHQKKDVTENLKKRPTPYLGQKSKWEYEIPKIPSKCLYCPKTLSNVYALAQHCYELHNTSLLHECFSCDKRFTTIVDRRQHLRAVHGSLRNIVCKLCNQTIENELEASMHILTCVKTLETKESESKETSYSSGNECANTTGVDRIMSTCDQDQQYTKNKIEPCDDTNNGLKDYKKAKILKICLYCSQIFSNVYLLMDHCIETHQTYLIHECFTCNERFRTITERRYHLRMVHGSSVKVLCKFCKEFICDEANIKMHCLTCFQTNRHKIDSSQASSSERNQIEQEYDADASNEYCMFGNDDVISLNDSESESNLLEPQISIYEDDNSFNNYANDYDVEVPSEYENNPNDYSIEDDVVLYKRRAPKWCVYCPTSFASAFKLITHTNTVHKTLLVHDCYSCDERFKTVTDRRNHLVVAHGSNADIVCKLCRELIITERKMNIHFFQCKRIYWSKNGGLSKNLCEESENNLNGSYDEKHKLDNNFKQTDKHFDDTEPLVDFRCASSVSNDELNDYEMNEIDNQYETIGYNKITARTKTKRVLDPFLSQLYTIYDLKDCSVVLRDVFEFGEEESDDDRSDDNDELNYDEPSNNGCLNECNDNECTDELIDNEYVNEPNDKVYDGESIDDEFADKLIDNQCADKLIIDQCADEPINNQCADQPINDQCDDEPINDQCADEPINDQCADDPINDECADEPINDQCADEPINDQCADERINDQCADESIDSQCADEPIDNECTVEQNVNECEDMEDTPRHDECNDENKSGFMLKYSFKDTKQNESQNNCKPNGLIHRQIILMNASSVCQDIANKETIADMPTIDEFIVPDNCDDTFGEPMDIDEDLTIGAIIEEKLPTIAESPKTPNCEVSSGVKDDIPSEVVSNETRSNEIEKIEQVISNNSKKVEWTSNEGIIQCFCCNRKFTNHGNLVKHRLVFHRTLNKTLSCNFCFKQFTTEYDKMNHKCNKLSETF